MISSKRVRNIYFISVMSILIMDSKSVPLCSPLKTLNGVKLLLYECYACFHNGKFHNGMAHDGGHALSQFPVMSSPKRARNTDFMSVMSILIMDSGNAPL